jgi:hypothetical protein
VTAPAELRRLRRQLLASAVHKLGERALFELLDELARHHDIGDDIDRRLRRYADRLNPELLRAVGGDRFPPTPLRAVRSHG